MTKLHKLERILDKFFNESFPSIPTKWKKFLVKYLSIITFVGGVLTLISGYNLYHWANNTQTVTYNSGPNPIIYQPHSFNFGIWVSLILLLVAALLYLSAYKGLKKQLKIGWNLIFYGIMVNILYSFVILFTLYGSSGAFILDIVGLGLCLYILFQIRSAYIPRK